VDDLIAFVRARLDEDEAAARAVEDNSEPWPGQWEADGNYALRTHNGWVLATAGTPGGEFRPGVLAHIARHDPARALRDVAADRLILAVYVLQNEDPGYLKGLKYAIACRAERFSDHPDYRPEWRP
jgi:Family of unknown function (DUF6221)